MSNPLNRIHGILYYILNQNHVWSIKFMHYLIKLFSKKYKNHLKCSCLTPDRYLPDIEVIPHHMHKTVHMENTLFFIQSNFTQEKVFTMNFALLISSYILKLWSNIITDSLYIKKGMNCIPAHLKELQLTRDSRWL